MLDWGAAMTGQILYSTGVGNRIVAVGVAAAVSLFLAYAPEARAAGDSKWYIGASVPVMYIDDTDTVTEGSSASHLAPTQPQTPYRGKAVTKYKTGYKLEGVLGYELGSNFRIELELFYAEADVDKLNYSGISATTLAGSTPVPGKLRVPVRGTAEQMGGLVNLWYDFDTGSNWVPYIGAGVGFIKVDMGGLKYDDNALAQKVTDTLAGYAFAAGQQGAPDPATLPPIPDGWVPEVSSTDTVFAYQIAAGVSYRFRDNIMFRLGYRLQEADEDVVLSGQNANGSVKTETDLKVQFIEAGIRYHF